MILHIMFFVNIIGQFLRPLLRRGTNLCSFWSFATCTKLINVFFEKILHLTSVKTTWFIVLKSKLQLVTSWFYDNFQSVFYFLNMIKFALIRGV